MSDKPIPMTRREALATIGGAALGSAMSPRLLSAQTNSHVPVSPVRAPNGPPAKGSSSRPNVLWITGEGIPLKALSCYGSTLIQTPHIDRIANEGMRFENSFVTNALCAPSRATLLTGQI